MNLVLLLLFSCALVGLFTGMRGNKGYFFSLVASGLVAGAFLLFPSLMS